MLMSTGRVFYKIILWRVQNFNAFANVQIAFGLGNTAKSITTELKLALAPMKLKFVLFAEVSTLLISIPIQE